MTAGLPGFPGSRPLREVILAQGEDHVPAGNPDWPFMSLSPLIAWVYCDCPWWHRLPFAGRFVHARLPYQFHGTGDDERPA